MNIEIGAPVRTRNGRHVGHVHRVLVDLDDNSATGIVVLKGRVLTRDVLVPLDFIDHVSDDEVVLTIDESELNQLPDFTFNEVIAPPPALTSVGQYPDGSFYIPVWQRKRLGQHHVDITHDTRVHATDGDIGRVEQVEVDPITGELEAFWIRADGIFRHDIRIPAEWIERADESGVYVKASKDDVERRLGAQSRAFLRQAA
jgi:uncharacterized protein YrrD